MYLRHGGVSPNYYLILGVAMCAYQLVDIFRPDKITNLLYVEDGHHFICHRKEKKWDGKNKPLHPSLNM